jgi:hypothetical protein
MSTSNGRRRRQRIAAGAALLVLLATLGILLRAALHQATIIEYDNEIWRTPDKTTVCPGDVISFPVAITVNEAPAFMRLVESWCREDGICPYQYTSTQHIALVEPYHIETMARRTAPVDLTPGVWQLNHINESHADNRITVSAWAVRVIVRECGEDHGE